jgi:hypothetical protein
VLGVMSPLHFPVNQTPGTPDPSCVFVLLDCLLLPGVWRALSKTKLALDVCSNKAGILACHLLLW